MKTVVNEPLNIAMISAQANPLMAVAGGQGTHVAELSGALARAGHRVTVYTRRDNPDMPEAVQTSEGYNVIQVTAGPPVHVVDSELLSTMGSFAQCLASQWADRAPDVTHAHYWMSGVVTELAARQLALPTVLTFHGLGRDEVRHRLELKLAKTTTRVSASCTAEAFELIRLGRPRRGISVIPCGVDVEVFTPYGPSMQCGAAPRIVSIGNMLPCSGFDTMIRALPHIPYAEFLVVGQADTCESSAEMARLRGLAEQLDVAHRLRLQRAVAAVDMPALLRSADVVVCTPADDPSGVVALRAMACGVPVVASAVGALVDIVVDDVTGHLLAHRDPRQLANVLNSLLRDSFLRRSLGGAGRDRATARYRWDRIAADTARLYQASLGAHKSTAATG